MAPVWLAYRLQLYKPRSVDPTESALLVPIGAAHSDNFDVATISGVAGVQPYLQKPQGTPNTLDPVNKNVTTGTWTVSVGDKSLGSNAIRWATAFLGDANGRNRLKGCKAILYEQTTAGGAWNQIFTGRVGNVSLDGKLKLSLELKSSVDDLSRKKVFLYDPHPNATEAFRSAIFPPRLVRSWGAGTIPAGAWLSATVTGKYTDANGLTHGFLSLVNTGEDLQTAALVTRQGAAFSAGLAPGAVFLKVTAGGATGLFRVPRHSEGYAQTYNSQKTPRRFLQRRIGQLDELPSTHPLHMVLPANGTAVTFYVQGDDRAVVSAQMPLFIDDVHPLKLWGYILDGYFGVMDDAGNARPIAPRDTSAAGPWDYTNPASPSFSMVNLPSVRFLITAPQKTNDWIIANLCQPFNLGFRIDGLGRVIPLDLRVTSSTSTTGSITDADLTELPTDWTVDGSKALLAINASYYVDVPQQMTAADLFNSSDPFPDMGTAAQITSVQEQWLVVNPLLDVARDAGDAVQTIDAQGIRITENEFNAGTAGVVQSPGAKLSTMTKAQQDTLAPYAGGAVTVPLSFNRSSAFAASGHEGQFWGVTVSTLPDPATNQRGGARVGLCLSKVEQGLKILATFLDVGSVTAAATPTIGTLAITNGGLDVPITVNAAGDPVQVEFIVTAAGTGARPADTDSGWRLIGDDSRLAIITSTKRQPGVPANTRLWVRARSRPMGTGLKLPSAYVFPAGGAPAGSIDVAAIATPSALAASGITGNRATLTWTNGDPTQSVEVYRNLGGIPGGGWTDAMRVTPTLAAGSATVQLRNLTPSSTYGAAVRHRDAFGGTSAFATTTFTTTGTPSVAPIPPPPGIGGGGSGGTGVDVNPSIPLSRPGAAMGVSLLLNPADPSYDFEIQRAPDVAGSPGAFATIATVSGRTNVFHDTLPLDGAKQWYQVKHVGFGDSAAVYTTPVSATPIIQPAQGPTDSITTPLNSQGRFRCRARNSASISVPTGIAPVTLSWNTEDYDTGNLHDPGTNPSRITIPTGGDSGVWLIAASIDWASNATGYRSLVIVKNGLTAVASSVVAPANGLGTVHSVFAFDDQPAVGDYYEVQVTQTSGGALSAVAAQDTYFSATHVW